jgi:hypothetical protein
VNQMAQVSVVGYLKAGEHYMFMLGVTCGVGVSTAACRRTIVMDDDDDR